MHSEDTIASLITPPGVGGVSVVRVSGGKTREVLAKIVRAPKDPSSVARELQPASIVSASEPKVVFDQGMVVFFPGPRSFTGEDVAEFHLHGSPFLVDRVLEEIFSLGVRGARAGEFSERAYHLGKLDLSQAEAISDLIQSQTEAQSKQALEQLEGKLSQAISRLGDPLRETLAQIEAYIDFPEEDIDPQTYQGWEESLQRSIKEVSTYIESFEKGRLIKEGIKVALVGLPNAGKSSLMNALLGEERAIVTDVPGTTRDSIEESISFDGFQIRLFDTAGLEEKLREAGSVEKLGIERSWQKLREADLVAFVIDVSASPSDSLEVLERVKELNSALLLIFNKVDLLDGEKLAAALKDLPERKVQVSAKRKDGLEELREALLEPFRQKEQATSSVLISSRRHLTSLKDSKAALENALRSSLERISPEFISLELRTALGALDEIIGVTSNEDILERVFSQFCIGK